MLEYLLVGMIIGIILSSLMFLVVLIVAKKILDIFCENFTKLLEHINHSDDDDDDRGDGGNDPDIDPDDGGLKLKLPTWKQLENIYKK